MQLSVFQGAANTVQVKAADELGEIFSDVSGVLEAAAAMSSPSKGRGYVIQELEQLRERMKIPASNGRKSDGEWAGLASMRGWGGCEGHWRGLPVPSSHD